MRGRLLPGRYIYEYIKSLHFERYILTFKYLYVSCMGGVFIDEH